MKEPIQQLPKAEVARQSVYLSPMPPQSEEKALPRMAGRPLQACGGILWNLGSWKAKWTKTRIRGGTAQKMQSTRANKMMTDLKTRWLRQSQKSLSFSLMVSRLMWQPDQVIEPPLRSSRIGS